MIELQDILNEHLEDYYEHHKLSLVQHKAVKVISNNRILSLESGNVTFKWRDYSDCNQWKEMTLTADEFIRRFLMHVLPQGFMKIRHFGFLSSRGKQLNLLFAKAVVLMDL